METNPPAIYLEHIDASRNMARFYHLFLRKDLFGTIVAVRRWGRIGQSGREITWPCASVTEAVEQIECFAKVKRRRGYRDLLCISPPVTNQTAGKAYETLCLEQKLPILLQTPL